MLGTLIGIYKLPGVFLAYPGGLLGRRFGLKPVGSAPAAVSQVTPSADTQMRGSAWPAGPPPTAAWSFSSAR